MHPNLIKRPTSTSQKRVNIAGNQTHPNKPDPPRTGPATAQPIRSQSRRRSRPTRTNNRGLQAGKRIPGVMIIEDQHRRRPRNPSRHILRETRNPLQPIHPHRPTNRGRQRNNPRRRPIRETQKIRRRIHRIPHTMKPVGSLHQLHNLPLPTLQRPLNLPTRDHRKRGHGACSAFCGAVVAESVVVIQASPHWWATHPRRVPARPSRRGSRAAPRRPPCCARCGCCRPASNRQPATAPARCWPHKPR